MQVNIHIYHNLSPSVGLHDVLKRALIREGFIVSTCVKHGPFFAIHQRIKIGGQTCRRKGISIYDVDFADVTIENMNSYEQT